MCGADSWRGEPAECGPQPGGSRQAQTSRISRLLLPMAQGTEMARTAVTREINSYIRAHSLQDPKNGRRILPDTKLRKLLKVGKAEELTYFNLQRYMSPHFAKAGQPFPAANTVV